MQVKTKETLSRIALSLMRAVIISLVAYLFLSCCMLPIPERGTESAASGVSFWNALIAFLAFGSVTLIVRRADRRTCARTAAAGKVSEKLLHNFGYLFADVNFWLDTLVFILFSLLVGSLPLYTHIRLACFYHWPADSTTVTVVIPLIAHTLLFFSRIVAYLKIGREWARTAKVAAYYQGVKGKKRQARAQKRAKRSEARLVATDLLLSFIGYLGSPIILVVPSIVIAPIIVFFTEYPTIFAFVLVVLAVVCGIRYGRAIKKRRAFLRNLTRVCQEKGIPLSPIKRPYRSLFREMDGESFSLTYKGEVYHCKLLGSLSRATPYLFSEEGYVIRRRRISFRRLRITLFNIDKRIDFHFETDGKKAIIVLPVPRELYLTNEIGVQTPIDTGDQVGDYRIYNASGFLGALERDFLGRH